MIPHGSLSFFSGLMMPIMQFVGNLGYVVVAILGGYLAIQKTIEVGDIQSFIQYVRNFHSADPAGGTGSEYVTVHWQRLPSVCSSFWRKRKRYSLQMIQYRQKTSRQCGI